MSIEYKLKIKNFGPIKEGYKNPTANDFFLISKCTVIIGEQGTGKSTIAKIASTFLWLEKDFIQKGRDVLDYTAEDFVNLCKNQKIDSYFSKDTYLCYKSSQFIFEYSNAKFTVKKEGSSFDYEGRKIMYLPSERNLISVIEDADEISGLPYPLKSSISEFYKASKTLGQIKKKLPLNGFEYYFDKVTNTGYVYENKTGSSVRLSDSSSGLQSFVPLYIITDYLANNVTNDFFSNIKNFSVREQSRAENIIRSHFGALYADKADAIINKLQQIYKIALPKEITEEDKNILMGQLKSILNICFFNIVEEPEQNLFPTSQVKAVETMISAMNSNVRNSLLITTHSPFVLSSINNFIYASRISYKNIPGQFYINSKFCHAYLTQDGNIVDIYDKESDLINTTVIDDCATMLNSQYDSLYESELEKHE